MKWKNVNIKGHVFSLIVLGLFLYPLNCFCSSISNVRNLPEASGNYLQQAPFSFFNPVPSQIRAGEKVDMSFTVNNEIVSQYRYRLEVPAGAENSISKSLLSWSDWINEAFTDIILLKVIQTGRYKLTIEYKAFSVSDVKRFERSFEVNATGIQSNTIGKVENAKSSTESRATEKAQNTASSGTVSPDYEKLLLEAIQKRDTGLFRISIQNGAGLNLKGNSGGNIFHVMNGLSADGNLISTLMSSGVSINETDNFGNTPLHIAIMSRETDYARSLINQGAELNINNKVGLAPLHIAAFLAEDMVATALLEKGANFNLRGASGYTPLHIASLMNSTLVAKDLLLKGASTKIKTEQKLSAKAIAKIQNNMEIEKLIAKHGNYNVNQNKVTSAGSNSSFLGSIKLNPQFEVNLAYNKELIKKRQFARTIQIISVPLFALSTAGAAYMKIEGNRYYSSYLNAETMDMARYYYDKAMQYDKNTYIFGGVSIVSLYGFIHSTISKKNITVRMRKTLY